MGIFYMKQARPETIKEQKTTSERTGEMCVCSEMEFRKLMRVCNQQWLLEAVVKSIDDPTEPSLKVASSHLPPLSTGT